MTNGMDDYFGVRGLVKHQIGVRRCRHTANGQIVSARADIGVQQQKIDDRLNAGLNATGAQWRMDGDMTKYSFS